MSLVRSTKPADDTSDSSAMENERRIYRFGFILQRVLGWATVAHNFRTYVEQDSTIIPSWTDVTYYQPDGWIERLPLVPERAKGTVRGALQIRAGFRRPPRPAIPAAPLLDAMLFNHHSLCLFARDYMRQVPSVLVLDVTPRQYDAMAPFYGRRAPRDSVLTLYKQRQYEDVFRLARFIAPCSHWVKESLIHDYNVPEEKIVVVPHGVDVEQWTPPMMGTREASFVAAQRLPRILFVGGDFERKGGPELIDWFVASGQGRCELHMVTRTSPALAAQVPGLHLYTDMEANDPRLMHLYRESHLFVLPTRADCYGVAIIEAMATGLPVIATRVGGVPEIVDDGEQGFLIAPNDHVALAARLDCLLEDTALRHTMGERGREKVLARFDARENSKQLVELMKMADVRVVRPVLSTSN